MFLGVFTGIFVFTGLYSSQLPIFILLSLYIPDIASLKAHFKIEIKLYSPLLSIVIVFLTNVNVRVTSGDAELLPP